jgi:hypothetical protein
MRKYYAFIVLIGLFAGCRKKELGIEMLYRREFSFPIGLDVFRSHNFEFKEIACDTSVFFQANSVTAKQVTRIEPQAMSIRSIFGGPDNSYNVIDRVEVWVSDPNRPNLSAQIAFFRDNVPINTGNRLDLVPNNIDMRPFLIDGNRFNLRINLRLRDITQRSIDSEWNATFFAFLGQ